MPQGQVALQTLDPKVASSPEPVVKSVAFETLWPRVTLLFHVFLHPTLGRYHAPPDYGRCKCEWDRYSRSRPPVVAGKSVDRLNPRSFQRGKGRAKAVDDRGPSYCSQKLLPCSGTLL